MKKAIFLLIGFTTLFFYPTFSQSFDEIKALCSELEEKYSVQIYVDDMPKTTWKLNYQYAEMNDYGRLYTYLQLFDKEFSKYPLGFHKSGNLKALVFVKSLGISGQFRASIPDYYSEVLLFDFICGDYNKTYQKHVIHHEYYHMLEEEFNGDAYWKDLDWVSLNSEDISYGSGGSSVAGNSNMYAYTHPETGFVNLYSMSAPEEDKAEIFASLFVKSEYEKLSLWSKEDDVLNEKMTYMINFLISKDELFNIDYWMKLHQ